MGGDPGKECSHESAPDVALAPLSLARPHRPDAAPAAGALAFPALFSGPGGAADACPDHPRADDGRPDRGDRHGRPGGEKKGSGLFFEQKWCRFTDTEQARGRGALPVETNVFCTRGSPMNKYIRASLDSFSMRRQREKRQRVQRLRTARGRCRLQVDLLESRFAPAAGDVLTLGVIGDFGVASSILNLGNAIVGTPDGEGDVAKLVHSWDPSSLISLGDNNYLAGEQFDTNITVDLQLGIALGKISADNAARALGVVSSLPIPGLITTTGVTTKDSFTVTGLPVALNQLAVGMAVYDTSPDPDPTAAIIPFPTGPESPFFATITSIAGTDNDVTITLSLPADQTTTSGTPAKITLLPENISLQSLDGLSHIDRNIGRYYSDFIYPYVASTPPTPSSGQFGNGSPTGTNRFFPTPGNHDWADPFSDGGASTSDLTIALPSRTVEVIGTLKEPLAPPFQITVNDKSLLTVGMSVLGPGLPTVDPSTPTNFDKSVLSLFRIQSIDTNAPSVNFTGNTTTGSTIIDHVSSLDGLADGMAVSDGGSILPGTTIANLDNSDPSNLKITLSQMIQGAGMNAVSFSAANYTINLTISFPYPGKLAPDGASNSTYQFIPIFTSPTSLAFAPGNLDPYLNYFAGLNPTNSPGFQIGTTIVNGAPVPLAQPYYYSYTAGTTSTGRPLIEFFSFDSEPADPNLLRNPSFDFTGNTTVGSELITGVSTSFINNMLAVGMEVSGTGIPPGSTIAKMDAAGGTITLDQNATATANMVSLSLRPAVNFTADIEADGVTITDVPKDLPNLLYGGIYAYAPGMEITGTGIQPGTKIKSVDPMDNTITLDTPATPGTQVALSFLTPFNVANSNEGVWLKTAMANSQAVWKIPYFHHSPYSSSNELDEGPNGVWMRLPFQQWGASAVMYGHVHNYERFSETDPAISGVSPAGTVAIPYFLNGSGGAPITAFQGPVDPGSQLRYNGEFGAMKVIASEGNLNLQFINVFGAVIDQVNLSAPPTPGVIPLVSQGDIYHYHLHSADNVSQNQAFLIGLYHVVLNRDPQTTELTPWLNALNAGATRDSVVQSFWNSPEHRGLEVASYYQEFLHRSAAPAEEAGWVAQLLSGVPESVVVQEFLGSPEYQALYSSATDYVNSLYVNLLGRTAGPAEVAGWVSKLNTGALTRAQVASGFLSSDESFKLAVDNDYTIFYHRPADALGEAGWISELRTGAQTYGSLAEAFLGLPEFYIKAQVP
jgi:hypothetical protein